MSIECELRIWANDDKTAKKRAEKSAEAVKKALEKATGEWWIITSMKVKEK